MSSENGSPLLSVVIPTRNRQKYAISSIVSILRIPDPYLEIVVQDNSDSRDLQELLRRNVQDSRLRYNYTPDPLSFIGNFNEAVRLATGDYLCFIGDDDGVNPEIMEPTRLQVSTRLLCFRDMMVEWNGEDQQRTLMEYCM